MEFNLSLSTDVGIQKKTNQDSCCIKQAVTDKGNILLAVICDGMGGLSKGEVASAAVIKAFSDWFENEFPAFLSGDNVIGDVAYSWGRMIRQQNQIISEYGERFRIQLGSTVTAMLILENGRYIIGHVGDSRAYRITDSNAEVLTEDQTLVAREIQKGRLTPEAAEKDPRRNVLLQCVGASRTVEPAFYYGRANSGECYMLCSDGFRHEITAEEIARTLGPSVNHSEQEMESHIVQLIDLNKYRHENDNITALLIKAV